MSYLDQAQSIYEEIVENRRHLHQNPEIGYDLPETSAFVREKLESYGYETEELIENSVIALAGDGEKGKTLLLRADMDALPIVEQSGLDFSSQNNYSHTCGHDIHTSIMLAVAKLIKENEDKLEGQVKFVFQPAEELLTGAETMVEAGLLENPKVDAALAAHVQPTEPTGFIFVDGIMMASANNYRLKVKGVGSHGAMPHLGVDPVFIATQIIEAFQSLVTKEVPFAKSAVITTGGFESDGAMNVIPGEVVLEGTMRTFDTDTQEHLKQRMPEVAKHIAEAYRGEVEFEFISDVPPLYNDETMSEEIKGYAEDILADQYEIYSVEPAQASEDFAFVSQQVPTVYFNIGMMQEGVDAYPVHHPKVVFDEEMMVPAAALFTEAAINWLENNK
jgi:amidohydrolase